MAKKNNNEITFYRVRKSFCDIRSQSGAFMIFEAAIEQAIKSRRNIYDNDGKCVWHYKNNV